MAKAEELPADVEMGHSPSARHAAGVRITFKVCVSCNATAAMLIAPWWLASELARHHHTFT
jgi:hypothetical protein